MKGFVVTYCKNVELDSNKYRSILLDRQDVIKYGNFLIEFSKSKFFKDDKIVLYKDNAIYILDGVVFNTDELIQASGLKSWDEAFESEWRKKGVLCIKNLRGSFCGIVISNCDNLDFSMEAFTNQSGERALYYYSANKITIIATNVELITEKLRALKIRYLPNWVGLKEMLCTGSILHWNTPVEGVYRIMAGCSVNIQCDLVNRNRYHMFHNIPEHTLSLEDCIERADILFTQAVNRIYSKCEKYGYKIESDLSAGLDSRLVNWVAHKLGYNNIVNICYCYPGKIDASVSKKIAKDLGNEYLFYPMKDGNFLKDVDQVTQKTGGQIVYSLCTGAIRAFNSIDNSDVAVISTGLLGEIVNAYWTEGTEHTAPNYTNVKTTKTLTVDIPEEYKKDYDNYEQMNLYEYSNLLYLSSALARQGDVEVYSPFVDVDFLEFAYKIPLKWRKNYYFDVNWYMWKYPDAAKYVWQTKQKPIDYYFNRKVYLKSAIWKLQDYSIRGLNKFFRSVGISHQFVLKAEMNPYEKYYVNNKSLRIFFDEYYSNSKEYVDETPLKDDVDKLFNSGYCLDKILAINVLSIIKLYFPKGEKEYND